MRVFKISGKYQQNGVRNSFNSFFDGYFIKEDGSNIFTGYLEEQNEFSSNPVRYIKGLYIEQKQQLVFLKLASENSLEPTLYSFFSLENDGIWKKYNWFWQDFFPPKSIAGLSKVQIKEVNENIEILQEKIKETYEQVASIPLNNNLLNEDIEEYTFFLGIHV